VQHNSSSKEGKEGEARGIGQSTMPKTAGALLKSTIKAALKEAAFRFYGFLFSIAARFPVKENRVVLFSLHDASFTDGLGEIEKELKKRTPSVTGRKKHVTSQNAGKTTDALPAYEILRVDRQDMFRGKKALLRFFFADNLKMARAGTIFLNNNFFPMNYMHFNKNTTVVQVWHGQGVFKKFGLDIPQPRRERRLELGVYAKTDYVVCSAPSCKEIYMSAFGLRADQVLPIGNPVQDQYFGPNVSPAACAARRAAFDRAYPECKGKYLILYSPTFRDDDSSVLAHMDLARLKEAADKGLKDSDIPTESQILLRLHPHDAEANKEVIADYVTNLNHYPNSNELCFLADVMITDYSSICMNMALLDKPMVFYAYDLETFARDFYFPYETVGGPIAKTMDELCHIFETGNFREEKRRHFRELHFGTPTPGATARLLDFLHL